MLLNEIFSQKHLPIYTNTTMTGLLKQEKPLTQKNLYTQKNCHKQFLKCNSFSLFFFKLKLPNHFCFLIEIAFNVCEERPVFLVN